MQLTGLHHVTAVTANAPANLAFYTQTLGLRLVKKTVNQDDVSAYHLFYGDELGNAGTEVTFFDWPQSTINRHGAGTIGGIGLRVAGRPALDWWAAHLTATNVLHGSVVEANNRSTLSFEDPEGQRITLIDDTGAPLAPGTPWPKSPVPTEFGIRGLGAITLTVPNLEPTALVLTEVLGMRQTRLLETEAGIITVFETCPGGVGAEVHVQTSSDRGFLGSGGVHHVAFRTPNREEQAAWMERIRSFRIGTSDLVDRYYFQSLYFREPSGILFEIATDGPGFATDEPATHLGERLSLPPFLEPRRAQIESGLKPLDTSA